MRGSYLRLHLVPIMLPESQLKSAVKLRDGGEARERAKERKRETFTERRIRRAVVKSCLVKPADIASANRVTIASANYVDDEWLNDSYG